MDGITILGGTVALLFRAFVAQPYDIPASSMAPTLEVGDTVWATKFSYGYSNLSQPLGHILPGFTYGKTGPARGDVVIFRLPTDPSVDYVKRVIGLPGDTVQVRRGVTYLNGTPLARTQNGIYAGPAMEMSADRTAEAFTETLPDGRHYTIIEMGTPTPGDETDIFTVPDGHYFMLGDNRDNSNDSRFSVGFVQEANIIAKVAVVITWPNGTFTRREVK